MRRAVLCGLILCSSSAFAATHRVALLVGNNAGSAELRPLHYAEADAGKMARVLAEVGGMGADDLFLLQGQSRAAVEHALDLARVRVDGWHHNPTDRVLLIFYFSGHSDGQALELGRERISFEDLRQLLSATHADVRVAVVDSCRSGAMLASKGGVAGPSYDIRLSDDLASTGQVLLASSAADEVALESVELGGSVFTHYFASGLRGAADTSGDGRVTLTEAYQYAYQHTLANTSVTSFGAQHPSFDYRLSGQGELVLADLSTETASLELPPDFTQAVVNDLRRDQVVAELSEGAGRKLAVDAGEYAVRASRDGHAYLARVFVGDGEHRSVSWDELHPLGDMEGSTKGPELSAAWEPPDPPLTLGFFGGTLPGVAVGPLIAGNLVLAGRDGLGPRLSVSFGSGSGSTDRVSYTENSVRGLFGWTFGLHLDRFLLYAGPALGGGVGWQTSGGQTGLGDLAAVAGAAVAFNRRFSLALEGQLGAELLRENGAITAAFEPALWLGVRVALGE